MLIFIFISGLCPTARASVSPISILSTINWQSLLINLEPCPSTIAGWQDSRITDGNRVLHKAGNYHRASCRRTKAPSRKNQSPRRRTQHNANVLVAPILRLSPESLRIAFSNRFLTGIGSCRLLTRGFPITECSISSRTGAPSANPSSGVTPGAALTNWARSSIKVSKVSSESTRRHGGPTPRPTTSKATFPKKTAGTYNRRPAGQTLALYLTPPSAGQILYLYLNLPRPGGMHRQPPPS